MFLYSGGTGALLNVIAAREPERSLISRCKLSVQHFPGEKQPREEMELYVSLAASCAGAGSAGTAGAGLCSPGSLASLRAPGAGSTAWLCCAGLERVLALCSLPAGFENLTL